MLLLRVRLKSQLEGTLQHQETEFMPEMRAGVTAKPGGRPEPRWTARKGCERTARGRRRLEEAEAAAGCSPPAFMLSPPSEPATFPCADLCSPPPPDAEQHHVRDLLGPDRCRVPRTDNSGRHAVDAR